MRFCGLSAAVVLTIALAVPQAGAGGLTVRNTTDQDDDFTGPQVHFMYVLPSDGVDRALDTDGTIAASVDNFQTWLHGETGGRTLRVDTFEGAVDVTFLLLDETDEAMAANGVFLRNVLEQKLHDADFNAADKLYAVYYDGTNDEPVCGGGAWPPTLPGDTGAIYLRAIYNTVNECYDPALSHSGIQIMDYAIFHEMFHTLGFVPECATHHTLAGHVSDSRFDLMYAGSQPWDPTYLDVNRDDYYDADVPGCEDLSTSPFLQGPTAVRVTSVAATASPAGITVRWRTASTVGLLGFHVWRTDPQGKRSRRLNLRLLPALGTAHTFLDRSARRGRTYAYKVEALALDGSRVSVTTTAAVRRPPG